MVGPRYSLLTIAFFIALFASHDGSSQNFSLGLKAGPSITLGRFRDADLRDQFSNGLMPGYTIGGLISFPLKKNYTFITESAFTGKGKKLRFNSDEWTNKATFQFIDFSMALRKSYDFQLRSDVRSKIFFNLGPNIEYWLNGKGNLSAGGDPTKYDIVFDQVPDADFTINYYNEVNRWLFGLDIGAGMEAPITPTQSILLELRFTFGQTNLGKDNSSSTMEILGFADDLRMNMKTLSLTAAYVFAFDLKESKMGRSTKDKMIKQRKRKK